MAIRLTRNTVAEPVKGSSEPTDTCRIPDPSTGSGCGEGSMGQLQGLLV